MKDNTLRTKEFLQWRYKLLGFALWSSSFYLANIRNWNFPENAFNRFKWNNGREVDEQCNKHSEIT